MKSVRKIIGGLGNLMFKQAYVYAQMRKGNIPDLYVQSETYFKDFSEEIRVLYGDGITYIDLVSLHIRRGDYLEANNFYIDLTKTDYYKKAVDMFPNEKFLVFYRDRQKDDKTDENFAWQFMVDLVGLHRFELYNGKDEIDDMNTMASCKGHIMANSSFSWWASYLGNGETVCPKQWFTDGLQRCHLLDKWVQI